MKKSLLPLGLIIVFAVSLLSGCFGAKPSLGKDNKKEQKEYQEYLAKAVLNNTEAMSKLGDCYFYCLGTEGNMKEAFKWYLLAAKAGDVRANYMLGYCYYAGYGVQKDWTKARQCYETAARAGSMDAIAEMPSVEIMGRFSTVKNNIKLFSLSSRNEEKPSADQEYYLGLCYFYGRGTKQDVSKGLELLNKAARKGSWKANYELANIYLTSREVAKDEKSAVKYAEKAADQIGAFGRYNLAGYELHLKNITEAKDLVNSSEAAALQEFNNKIDRIKDRVDSRSDAAFLDSIKEEENKRRADAAKKKDKKAAKESYIENYKLAADAGFAPAQFEMGKIESEKGNSNAGFDWYAQAAERGYTEAQKMLHGEGYKDYLTSVANYDREAQYKLGVLLLDEHEKDGFEFVNLAMENGHPEARFTLAQCYFYGNGIDEDKGKAYYLYKAEAESGNANAQYMVGEYYWNGFAAVRKDMNSAYSWYYKAAEQKQTKALVKAGVCCMYGYGTDIDYGKAFSFLKSADDLGEESGAYYLGLCYEAGLGTEPSPKKAFELYSLSEGMNDKSRFKMATCYRNGIGVQKDVDKATDILLRLARNNFVLAQTELADLYMEGNNFRSGVNWYREALETSAYANYRIGECYQIGRGLDKSIRQAATYYKQAYDLAQKKIGQWTDDASDHYCLGLCYENGRGTDKDLTRALEQYKLAAAESFADSAEKVKSIQAKAVNQ